MDPSRSPDDHHRTDSDSLMPHPPTASPPSSSDFAEKSSLRFLITNIAAGSVIGKGGTTINEFQTQSGARIQLSRNHEYFPGTSDRIISLSGAIKEVLTAFHLILSKIISEGEKDNSQDMKPNQVRLIVPNPVCGAIIGKAGATIKSFVEESNASIKLSPLEQSLPGVNDRIVTITGTLDQQLRAAALIVTKLSQDPNYHQYSSTSLSYTGLALNVVGLRGPTTTGFPSMGYGRGPILRNGMNDDFRLKGIIPSGIPVQTSSVGVPMISGGSPSTTANFTIPDEQVGAIVGRGGKIITDIQQTTGVRIKISDRGDYVPGTNDRKVTITGTVEGVRMAQQVMLQKLNHILTPDASQR